MPPALPLALALPRALALALPLALGSPLARPERTPALVDQPQA